MSNPEQTFQNMRRAAGINLLCAAADKARSDALDTSVIIDAPFPRSLLMMLAEWWMSEVRAVEFDGGRPDLLNPHAVEAASTYVNATGRLPDCPTYGVCPSCTEGCGHLSKGDVYYATAQSEAALTEPLNISAQPAYVARLRRRVAELEAQRGDWQADARLEVRRRLGQLRLAIEYVLSLCDRRDADVPYRNWVHTAHIRAALEGVRTPPPDYVNLNTTATAVRTEFEDDENDPGWGEPYPTCPRCRDILRAISEDEDGPRECPRHGRVT